MREDLTADEVKRAAKATKTAALEHRFLEAWNESFPTRPAPVLQYMFHDNRKWRFDFAWPDQKLAVEIQGGAFIRGGHVRGAQQRRDFEKQREAVRLGWRVLPFNTKDLDDACECVNFVACVLTDAKEVAN